MKVRIIANKPLSSCCSDISEYIGQIFEGNRGWFNTVYVDLPDRGQVGLFDCEYEIVE